MSDRLSAGQKRKERFMLGLAVSELSLKPGQTRTQRELGYFCDCPHGTIQHVERIALKKMRAGLAGTIFADFGFRK